MSNIPEGTCSAPNPHSVAAFLSFASRRQSLLDGLTSERNGITTRVHIVGGPGSGKTTLSRQLAQRIRLQPIELDIIAGDGQPPDFIPSNPMPGRVAFVQKTSVDERWVTEGAFLWWTKSLFDAADLIVWLDFRRSVAIGRLTRRYIFERVAEFRRCRNPSQFVEWMRHPHLRPAFAFATWTWRYYDPHRPVVSPSGANLEELSNAATACALEPYGDKVLRISRPGRNTAICALVLAQLEERIATHD